MGSTAGEAECVRRAVGAAAGSPDNWSHLATQPGLRACTAPSFLLPPGEASRTPPLTPPCPRSPVSLPHASCQQASPHCPAKPTAPQSAPEVASPSVCAEMAQLCPPQGESSVPGTGGAGSSVRGAVRVLGWPCSWHPSCAILVGGSPGFSLSSPPAI